MTKAYEKMSVHDALYSAARKYPGSVEALAARMGKSANVMRSKLAPDIDTHHTTLEEALQIIELLDATVPAAADFAFNAIAYRLSRIVARHEGCDSVPDSPEIVGLALAGVVGLLCADLAATFNGKQPGQPILRREADQLRADIQRAMQALAIINDTVSNRTAGK